MVAQLISRLGSNRDRLLYVFIIAVLLSIMSWGHHSHWSFSHAAKHVEHADAVSSESVTHHVAKVSTGEIATTATSDLPHDSTVPEITIDTDLADKSDIEIEIAELGDVEEAITVLGEVKYDQDAVAQLSARVSGHVWRVEKRVGQPIVKGETLAIVESLAVGDAKTELLQALVASELKSRTLERMRGMVGSVALSTILEAEAAAREARVRLLNARQTLVSLGLPLRLEDLRGLSDERLVGHLQFLGLPETLRKSLDPETTTANLVPMLAPFDGMVIGRDVTVGEAVAPQDAHFTVADTSRMWLSLTARKEDAAMLRLGQSLIFEADAVVGPVRGTIDWISTEMDEKTRTLAARAVVDNPILRDASDAACQRFMLRANTFGTGRVIVRATDRAVMVPTAAVQFDGQRHFVCVREGNTFRRRDVQVGVVSRGKTEIVSGLAAGEQVAGLGSHAIKSEMAILAAQ